MEPMILVHCLVTSAPGAELVHNGEFDSDGNAILKKQSIWLQPGEYYTCRSSEEYNELLAMGAIREMDDLEKLTWRDSKGED